MKRFQIPMKYVGLLLAAALVGVSGLIPTCPARADTLPLDLVSVTPDRAANDMDTPVEISGQGFSNEGGTPQAFLGDTPLSQVEWVDETTLSAVVPWGLEVGTYTLQVVNPDGAEASLEAAFEVTQGVGQWNASAMDGGPVHSVLPIADPETPGLIYAYSGVTAAIYKSIDFGAHWATAGHAYGLFFTYNPSDPDTLYLNDQQSTDGGVTWHPLLPDRLWPGTDRMPGGYAQVFPDPDHPGTIFLAAAAIPDNMGDPSGLLRSSDAGQTWEAVDTDLGEDTAVTAMDFDEDTIFLGTRDGNLYRSINNGDKWVLLKSAQEIWGAAELSPSIGILKVNPYNPDELWITTHYSVTAKAQVVKVDLSSPEYTVTATAWPVDSYPRTLGFVEADTAFIASEWDNGWITSDGGAHWDLFSPATNETPDPVCAGKPGYSLALDPWDLTKKTFYIADEQCGVQKTTDGGEHWVVTNQGLHAMSPDMLEIDPANPARVYAKIAQNGWPGIFVSADGGQNWTFSDLPVDSGNPPPVTSLVAVNGERLFAGAHGIGPWIYTSEDQGGSWTRQILDPVGDYNESFHMPWTLKADPQNPETLLLIAVIGNREMTTDEFVSEIYRSEDNGETWDRLGLADQIGREVNNLRSLAFDPHDPDVVYTAGDHDILKSIDNGLTWSVIFTDERPIVAGPIAVEPVAPYRVYVGQLVSSDGGETWDDAHMPLWPQQIAFVPGSDTVYIAGDGLAYSPNGGATWQRVEGALGTTVINALAVGRNGERTIIYVGTPGGETPEVGFNAASANEGSPGSLEAGVYRLTEVHYYAYLPMTKR